MGKKLETPAQIQAIKELTAVHEQYIHDKASLRAKIEIEFDQRLRDAELKESRLMNVARELGVSQTRIGRIVGTTNWYTLRDKYALTRTEVLASMPEERTLVEYTVDTETTTITVTSATIAGEKLTGEWPLKYDWLKAPSSKWDAYGMYVAKEGNSLSEFVHNAYGRDGQARKDGLEIMETLDAAAAEAFDGLESK